MNKKGVGKWQAKIIEAVMGTDKRYTVAGLRMTIGAKRGVVERGIDSLLEIGSVKADPWKAGYCYRSAGTLPTAPVVEVNMRPQIVVTQS